MIIITMMKIINESNKRKGKERDLERKKSKKENVVIYVAARRKSRTDGQTRQSLLQCIGVREERKDKKEKGGRRGGRRGREGLHCTTT